MDRPTSLDEWITRLEELPLPLLQNSRDSLQKLDFDNIFMARLSNIALTDPGLTLTLLRTAALRPSKRLQGDILTLDVAAMILGMGSMKTLVAAMPLLETCVDDHTKTLYMEVVSRTYHGAYQAYGMARIRVDTIPEEIFTAAMLQEVGALMLLVHSGNLLTREIINNEERQIETLGFTLKQLSQHLVKHWRLSNFIQRSLDSEGASNNPRLYEIRLASNVAHAAERGWESDEMEQLISEIAHHLYIDIEDVLEEIRDTAIQTAGETPFYGVMPAAASLPGLNDVERARIEPAILTATAAGRTTLARMSALPATHHAPEIINAPTKNKAMRDDAALAATIQVLEAMLNEPLQLPKFLEALKPAFYNDLALNRSFFAMLSQDRKYLATRFIFGSEQGLRNLRIPVVQGNLFHRLLDKPQALWVKEVNRQRVLPLLPVETYKLIDNEDFFIMTALIKGKPLGVIYADRQGNDHPFDEVDYEKFRQLGQLLTKGFEQLGR